MICSQILMIRPAAFAFNAQTAINNRFQQASPSQQVQEKALNEFDNFVTLLQTHGIGVTVISDSTEPHTPDSIFPNNWVSFHEDGTIMLYPMFAPNRREERNKQVVAQLEKLFSIKKTIDLTYYEKENKFLEGTGSMVLDRANKVAYACVSPRTNIDVLKKCCQTIGYHYVLFDAVDAAGKEIYHTNVMMCVADNYTIVCMESIKDMQQKETFKQSLEKTGKAIIEINIEQMNHFAGNMLQVKNTLGDAYLVMSTQAYNSLNENQISLLQSFNNILHAPLNTIEQNGGGSARCMMAEIFLPIKASDFNK